MANAEKTRNQKIDELYMAVVGNGAKGLIGRTGHIENQMEEHLKWHLAQRGTIGLAIGGWIAAVAAGLFALFGG